MGRWLPISPDSLDDLSDVDTTTTAPVVDDLLQFDGANYVPVSVGDLVQSAGRWEQAFEIRENPTDRFTATATKTIANTTTETTLFGTGEGTLTFPADFFVAGESIIVRMKGQLSDTGTPDFTISAKLGSTVIATEGPTALSGISAAEWTIEIMLTCRSAGASGSFSTGGVFAYNGAGAIYISSASAVAVDTTAPQTLDLTWTWGTADPADTITVQEAIVEAHSPNELSSDALQPVWGTIDGATDIIYGWVTD